MTLRVGLLGCGRIARYFHLPALASLDGAQLVAVADPDPEALAHAARLAPTARREQDWRRAVRAGDLDAVVVCLPTDQHVAAATEALAAGLHVYLEKPVATDREGATALHDALEAVEGLVLMAGFNLRFHPLYEEARTLLDRGAVGAPVGVRTTFAAAARALPGWKRNRSTGGGALLDLASHHADLVHLLFGPVTQVQASVRSMRTEDDTAAATLTCRDGLVVQSLFALSAVQQDRIEVLGDAGTMVLDRYVSVRPQLSSPPRGDGRADRVRAAAGFARLSLGTVRGIVAPPPDPSFAAALAAFAAAARTGRPAAPTLEDGLRSLAVVLAAERSAAEGRAVAVEPLVEPGARP